MIHHTEKQWGAASIRKGVSLSQQEMSLVPASISVRRRNDRKSSNNRSTNVKEPKLAMKAVTVTIGLGLLFVFVALGYQSPTSTKTFESAAIQSQYWLLSLTSPARRYCGQIT